MNCVVFKYRCLLAGLIIGFSANTGVMAADDTATNSSAASPDTSFEVADLAMPLGRAGQISGSLNRADVDRYRKIIELQSKQDWAAADRLIADLTNPILLGHVLRERFLHPTGYETTYKELFDWLESYGDHPGATRVYRLAIKKRPEQADAPAEPEQAYLRGNGEFGYAAAPPLPTRDLTEEQRAMVDERMATIRSLVGKGEAAAARDLLSSQELRDWLSGAEYDAMRVRVARAYFAVGDDKEALRIAERAAKRSSDLVPEASWTAGLAAWRLGDIERAAGHFETLAKAEHAADDLVAGGAYWAARANGVLRKPMVINEMLRIAADYPRTMYGMLALRSLFDKPDFEWDQPRLSKATAQSLMRTPAVRRAVALSDIGQKELAEHELRVLYPRVGSEAASALLHVAEKLSLAGLEIRLGSQLVAVHGSRHDRSLYPTPNWSPRSGFTVDRALVFALVRQESVFRTDAESPAGARGLMQIMPGTASYIDGEERYNGQSADKLFQPAVNLELGQKYVRHLLELDEVGGNLIFMLAAYNAGPGRLQNWLDQIDYLHDPLLFIESVPVHETRRYIRRVLANLWTYRSRLDQSPTSLDQLAAGRWAFYRDQEADADALAELTIGR